MKSSEQAGQLAARVRHVMLRRAPELLETEGVCGAGIAWREGDMKFVVQTDAIERVAALRSHLPDRVDGFAVSVEVGGESEASLGFGGGVRDDPRPTLWRSLLRLLRPRRSWVAFEGR